MRFNTTVTVKSNGKMDVSMLYAMMDMSDYGFDDGIISESDVQDYIEDGWEVEDYNQDGFRGYIISKKDISASELSSAVDDTQNEFSEELNSLSFTREGLKYVLDWKLFDEEEGNQISTYKSFFTMSGGYMKLTVNLPVEPSASNATSVTNDGKTLEWDLLNLGPDQSIHLEFTLINIWLILGICAAVFGILVVIILILVISAQKKKAAQAQNMGYPQQDYNPQYGGAQDYNPQYGGAQDYNPQYGGAQNYNSQYSSAQGYNPQQPQTGNAPGFNPQYSNLQTGSAPGFNPQYSTQYSSQQSSTSQYNNSQNYNPDNNTQQPTPNLVADELTKLKKLLDDGVITQEEFENQKARLLNQ
jgi:hypothetical protein